MYKLTPSSEILYGEETFFRNKILIDNSKMAESRITTIIETKKLHTVIQTV
jgi:hypothetical protein